MTTLAEAQAAFVAELKTVVEAADANDKPVNAEIATHQQAIAAAQKKLAAASDRTINQKRRIYQMLLQDGSAPAIHRAAATLNTPIRAAGSTGATGAVK